MAKEAKKLKALTHSFGGLTKVVDTRAKDSKKALLPATPPTSQGQTTNPSESSQ